MKSTIPYIVALLAGIGVGYTLRVPETVTVEVVKEAPGPERVVTTPADTKELESLRVQLAEAQAELQKARQRPEALPIAACVAEPVRKAAVPSEVPSYQPRRRLFGRFR